MNESNSFLAHLIELRSRLLKSVIAIVIGFLLAVPWSAELYHMLAQPLLTVLPKGGQMIATEIATPFFIPIKVALLSGFLLALPVVLYQIWSFVAPGLYAHEKRWITPLIICSVILFLGGMAFAYFVVFPVIFGFITSTAPTGVAVMTDISKYFDFTLSMFVAFGVTFQVPIIVIGLVKMNVVSVDQFKAARPYVIVGAFVMGAIFTPPDVISQCLMAFPLWGLFEIGLLIARVIAPKKLPLIDSVNSS